ncbi:mobilization protein [Methylobacterium radiotolerans]|uniref:mobilization protein n=1 Tax=Methylobacterium radiotolerans TaxID=31998 RepID=UPI000975411C|nr:mobilization protein [Methylobacterium radiotolerans]ONF46444.1 mobilization protein [Methylobacterium radiotolerans]
MARRTLAERLAQLEAQKKTLQARLGQQERTRDTRRKVLLGALVLQRLHTSHDPAFTERLADWLRRELPGFLTREADRALFDDLIGQPDMAEPSGDQAGSTDGVEPAARSDAAA